MSGYRPRAPRPCLGRRNHASASVCVLSFSPGSCKESTDHAPRTEPADREKQLVGNPTRRAGAARSGAATRRPTAASAFNQVHDWLQSRLYTPPAIARCPTGALSDLAWHGRHVCATLVCRNVSERRRVHGIAIATGRPTSRWSRGTGSSPDWGGNRAVRSRPWLRGNGVPFSGTFGASA